MWYFWSLHQAAAQDRAHEGSSQTELDCLFLTHQINEEQSGGEGVPARICPKRSSLLLSCREKVTATPFSSWWFLCFKPEAPGGSWTPLGSPHRGAKHGHRAYQRPRPPLSNPGALVQPKKEVTPLLGALGKSTCHVLLSLNKWVTMTPKLPLQIISKISQEQ